MWREKTRSATIAEQRKEEGWVGAGIELVNGPHNTSFGMVPVSNNGTRLSCSTGAAAKNGIQRHRDFNFIYLENNNNFQRFIASIIPYQRVFISYY